MFRRFFQLLKGCFVAVIGSLESQVKQWTRPDTASLVIGIATDLTRSKSDLITENAFLRQQLIILKRQSKRPPLTAHDRGVLVLLASRFKQWREALLIVKPDTLLKWHRQGFRLFWKYRSNPPSRQPRVPVEVIHRTQLPRPSSTKVSTGGGDCSNRSDLISTTIVRGFSGTPTFKESVRKIV